MNICHPSYHTTTLDNFSVKTYEYQSIKVGLQAKTHITPVTKKRLNSLILVLLPSFALWYALSSCVSECLYLYSVTGVKEKERVRLCVCIHV